MTSYLLSIHARGRFLFALTYTRKKGRQKGSRYPSYFGAHLRLNPPGGPIIIDLVMKTTLMPNDEHIGQRLDQYLTSVLTDVSRSRIQQLIQDGNVLIRSHLIKSV